MKTKSKRQLLAIYANNAPDSTAWHMDRPRAQQAHRAAYAELQARKA